MDKMTILVGTAGQGVMRSLDGGDSWTRVGVTSGIHSDAVVRAMVVHPDDPNVWIQSNDGGANITRDGGVTWSTQSNQPTAELYQVDISDEFPYRLFAGQQDNSTISVPSLPLTNRAGGQQAYWIRPTSLEISSISAICCSTYALNSAPLRSNGISPFCCMTSFHSWLS